MRAVGGGGSDRAARDSPPVTVPFPRRTKKVVARLLRLWAAFRDAAFRDSTVNWHLITFPLTVPRIPFTLYKKRRKKKTERKLKVE